MMLDVTFLLVHYVSSGLWEGERVGLLGEDGSVRKGQNID